MELRVIGVWKLGHRDVRRARCQGLVYILCRKGNLSRNNVPYCKVVWVIDGYFDLTEQIAPHEYVFIIQGVIGKILIFFFFLEKIFKIVLHQEKDVVELAVRRL